jgi:hypothetical protein
LRRESERERKIRLRQPLAKGTSNGAREHTGL